MGFSTSLNMCMISSMMATIFLFSICWLNFCPALSYLIWNLSETGLWAPIFLFHLMSHWLPLRRLLHMKPFHGMKSLHVIWRISLKCVSEGPIDQSYKSQNAPVPYPIMHRSGVYTKFSGRLSEEPSANMICWGLLCGFLASYTTPQLVLVLQPLVLWSLAMRQCVAMASHNST